MCIDILPHYKTCKHNATSDPLLAFIDRHECLHKDCESPPKRVEVHDGRCPSCLGDHAIEARPVIVGLFKHCWQSEICGHEWGHANVVGLERYDTDPEFVLVTPEKYNICPDCNGMGYDMRFAGTDRPPKTSSTMPLDYEGLTRIPIDAIGSTCPDITPTSMPGLNRAMPGIYKPPTRHTSGGSGIRAASSHLAAAPPYTTSAWGRPQMSSPSSARPESSEMHSASIKPTSYRQRMVEPDLLNQVVTKDATPKDIYGKVNGEEAISRLRTVSTLRLSHPEISHSESITAAPPADMHSHGLDGKLTGVVLRDGYPRAFRSSDGSSALGLSQIPSLRSQAHESIPFSSCQAVHISNRTVESPRGVPSRVTPGHQGPIVPVAKVSKLPRDYPVGVSSTIHEE
ncbi:uncharacterized protein BP5553_04383 [Venustampulla echinocandica]|uniref:Uncharacterized protein n=1 Tax=Venustampulla echinocandica TaxID=2656787 RepID=A0A370TN39_9HELO|nr:uncharacterized protein BP5553_04383 [Venustampulla echinocandica]RDL36950.1 hypothetical protein BP5553_04383 [Venustampulla echinocandica]